jgi:hypothetical protein
MMPIPPGQFKQVTFARSRCRIGSHSIAPVAFEPVHATWDTSAETGSQNRRDGTYSPRWIASHVCRIQADGRDCSDRDRWNRDRWDRDRSNRETAGSASADRPSRRGAGSVGHSTVWPVSSTTKGRPQARHRQHRRASSNGCSPRCRQTGQGWTRGKSVFGNRFILVSPKSGEPAHLRRTGAITGPVFSGFHPKVSKMRSLPCPGAPAHLARGAAHLWTDLAVTSTSHHETRPLRA